MSFCDFFQSLSLRFAALTSSGESGRFDAPFSYNELVAALSRCHESSGADGLPYSAFKVTLPWWRHLLLSFFNLILRFAVVPSAWKSSLVVHSSSVTVIPLSLTLIVPYLSPLVLSKSSNTWSTLALHHTFHHSWMCRKVVSVGAPTLLFAALWTPCVSAIRSTLMSLSLTLGKPSTLDGSKPHWFVSMTSASQVVFGIVLPISSAALCPRSVLATRLPSHGLTLPSHKGGSSHLSCSICWWTALPPLSVLPSLVSRLVDSDPFRHVCQLYADDLVILAESQAHLQHALDVVHTRGLRWRFSYWSHPSRRLWSSVLPAVARIVPSILGDVSLPLVPQYRYLGVTLTPTLSWGPHVDLVCARGDRLFHQACAWCRGSWV